MKNSLQEQQAQEIETALNSLEGLLQDDLKTKVRLNLSKLFLEMKYNAIAEEVKNNRHAKDNAIMGLKMYYRDKTGDRINPITREVVWRCEGERKQKIDNFYNTTLNLINEHLDNGTETQKEYLKLKLNYDNAKWRVTEAFLNYRNFLNELKERPCNLPLEQQEEYKSLENNYKKLEQEAKEAESTLDQFVLNNLD